MKDPNTITEAVEQLQYAVSQAIPGMQVTVSINLTASLNGHATEPVNGKNKEIAGTEHGEETPDPVPVSLDNLRTLLNAYVKAAGKDKALELVGKYSKGTKNPADINPDDYPAVIAEMGGYELEPDGDR